MRSLCYCVCNAPIFWEIDNGWKAINPDNTTHVCDNSIRIKKQKPEPRIGNHKIRGNKRSAYQEEMGLTTKKVGMNA